MKKDLEIALSNKMLHINEVASKLGIEEHELENYGKYKAKLKLNIKERGAKKAKTILITSMNPTPAGEGKTTVAIGLNDALNKIDAKSIVTLREPSLGPVFGIKGGATGGGYSQVVPMEDINLHFTGDMHAVTAAHNLLAAVLDNDYSRRNELCVEPKGILWHRVLDMNDRALRDIVIGLGEAAGQIRQSRFEITASSEIMAILGLCKNIDDLKRRLGNIIVAVNHDNEPVFARELECSDAMAVLLKDAIKPNLVQTLEKNPAIIHAGPFANIAHGTNSIIAIDIARRVSDYVVVEAGFGSDLGAEKFFNIVSRQAGMEPPDSVVIVATLRAVKYHGGQSLKDINEKNSEAIDKGIANLEKHIENMKGFGRPVVVALNRFSGDDDSEISRLKSLVEETETECVVTDSWSDGSEGAIELAEAVKRLCEDSGTVRFTYESEDEIDEKIEKIAKRIYGAGSITMTRKIRRKIKTISDWGYGHLPVCIAKTQKSFTDEPHIKGRPEGFDIEIKDVRVDAGAEFIVVYAGNIMTMPGLPSNPAAEKMTIDRDGRISGLF